MPLNVEASSATNMFWPSDAIAMLLYLLCAFHIAVTLHCDASNFGTLALPLLFHHPSHQVTPVILLLYLRALVLYVI